MSIFKTITSLLNQKLSDLKKSESVVPNVPVDEKLPLETSEIKVKFSSPVFPDRSEDAKSGTEFSASIIKMAPDTARENVIYNEFKSGNIPNFMRNFVELKFIVGEGTVKYFVSPDYLSIGSDSDFIRTPLNPLTAQKIAQEYGCTLPTRKMVNQIWKAASVKIEPIPNGPPYDAYMQSVDAYTKHNAKIETKRIGQELGKLVAGHKKDVVISKTLLKYPNNVAIYGWFYNSGKVIQDLNPVDHDKFYKDYSHGIRLVYRKIYINDIEYDLFDVLSDPKLCSTISDEGVYNASSMYSR